MGCDGGGWSMEVPAIADTSDLNQSINQRKSSKKNTRAKAKHGKREADPSAT